MKVTKIETGFHGADLFTEDGLYNEEQSAQNYADLLTKELEKQYPSAEVTVTFDTGVSGVLGYNLQTRVNEVGVQEADDTLHAELEFINDRHDLVFLEGDWAVPLTRAENTLYQLAGLPQVFDRFTKDETGGRVGWGERMPGSYDNRRGLPWSEVRGRYWYPWK